MIKAFEAIKAGLDDAIAWAKGDKSRGVVHEWQDPDDAPKLDADWFRKADVYVGDKLVDKGEE